MKRWIHYARELAIKEDSSFYMARNTDSIHLTSTGVEIEFEGSLVNTKTTRSVDQIFDLYEISENSSPKIKMIIDGVGDRSFRVRYGLADNSLINETLMVTGYPSPVNLRVEENDNNIVIQVEHAKIIVSKKPLDIKIFNAQGDLVSHIPSIDRMFRMPWKDAFPIGILQGDEPLVTLSMKMDITEKLYGLGERFIGFDRRGQNIEFYNQDCAGNTSIRSYKNIPFYMSSSGYGVYINSSAIMDFDLGAYHNDFASIFVADSMMDFTIFVGPDLKDVLTAYAGITGYSPNLPRWSYGLWMSRNSYESRWVAEDVGKKLRQEKIPCDVLHLDTYWFERDWVCDLKFSKERFPNPEEMFKIFEEMGFKISLWQMPFVSPDIENYIVGLKKGYFVKTVDGSIYEFDWMNQKYAMVDFTNQDAVSWYVDQLKSLLKMGARVIKTDIAESVPSDGIYNSVESKKIHNLFPLIYNKEIFEATEEVYGKGNGIVWARSSYAGGQRYPLGWSGDAFSTYEELAGAIRSALSFGLSGQPFWSHDIGGFLGRPTPDLYIRWAQVGLFSSHSRCHGAGNDNSREPWAFGQEAFMIFKKYAELRYRLMPYIFSSEDECVHKNIPFIRPLILHHQKDRNVYDIADQYYFGSNMMIAPILNDEGRRSVYIPEGIWYNFWTGERLEKTGWIDIEVSLETLPIYIPSGAIIVMGPKIQFVDEVKEYPLEIIVYSGRNSKYKYVNGDEKAVFTVTNQNGKTIFDPGDFTGEYSLKIIGG